jgi:hypothetical protein
MLRLELALFDGYERKWFRDDLVDAVQAASMKHPFSCHRLDRRMYELPPIM